MTEPTQSIYFTVKEESMVFNIIALEYLTRQIPIGFAKKALQDTFGNNERLKRAIYRVFIECRCCHDFKSSDPAYLNKIHAVVQIARLWVGVSFRTLNEIAMELMEETNEEVLSGKLEEGDYLRMCKNAKLHHNISEEFSKKSVDEIRELRSMNLTCVVGAEDVKLVRFAK